MDNPLYFVTSDIHSDVNMLSFLLNEAIKRKVEAFLIAGDLCPSPIEFLPLLTSPPFPIYIVKGNCDSLWDYRDMHIKVPEECFFLPFGKRVIAMTHSHTITMPEELPIELKSGDIFITGHTHVPLLEKLKSGIIHLNPGSPSRPRSEVGGTYALIYKDKIEIRKLDGKLFCSTSI